jgi:cyanophycinase-like exopeptidase
MFRLLLLLVLVISVVNIIQGRKIETENYTIWTIPDSASDVSGVKTEGGVAMIGGGSDCYPAFSWLIDHGNGGDFVVLRAGGTDAYNQFVYDLSVTLKKPLNSVTTISWNNREASFDEEVLTLLRNAEVIFFSGGDQYKYIQYWSDTPVQSIIQEKLLNGVSIGGTSAGLAIQGNFIYR